MFLTTHLMEEAERLCDRVAIIDHGRIVDIDSPERLVQRHCPERRVILRLENPSATTRFESIPGVGRVLNEDGRVTVIGRGDNLITDVIHCLSEDRMRVTDFPP